MTTTSGSIFVRRSPSTLDEVRAQLGLLPQPVAYALAAVAGVILVLLALKIIRKVVGRIIGIAVSLLISVGLKLYLADPGFHTWLASLAR